MVVGKMVNWIYGIGRAEQPDTRSASRGKKEDARALVQTLTVEAQAALVVLDEDPENMLSITGMDEDGNPGYSTDVVAHLPTEMLTGLIDYDPERQVLTRI